MAAERDTVYPRLGEPMKTIHEKAARPQMPMEGSLRPKVNKAGLRPKDWIRFEALRKARFLPEVGRCAAMS